MLKMMTHLNQTRQLSSISEESTTFREFQAFIEGQYLRRPGSEGLSAVAPNARNGAGSGAHLIDASRAPEIAVRGLTG
jgi:hypothetical protein